MLSDTLSTYSIPPIVLRLFDGTLNFVITQAINLSVKFPASGDVTPMTFYLTPLDSDCSIVLGHNWLTRCHAPNRFGTVNMEDNVNIKRS